MSDAVHMHMHTHGGNVRPLSRGNSTSVELTPGIILPISQSLDASINSVDRSAAEISALSILRKSPADRSNDEIDEVWGWISTSHPRLFAEFSGANSSVTRAASAGRALCARLRYHAYGKREQLFQQGDPADAVYMIIRGSVSMWSLPNDTWAGHPPPTLPNSTNINNSSNLHGADANVNANAGAMNKAPSVHPDTASPAISPHSLPRIPLDPSSTNLNTVDSPHLHSQRSGRGSGDLLHPSSHGSRNQSRGHSRVASTISAIDLNLAAAAAATAAGNNSSSPAAAPVAVSNATVTPFLLSPCPLSDPLPPAPLLPVSPVLPYTNPLYLRARTKGVNARELADAPPVPLVLLNHAQKLGMEPWKLRMCLLGSLKAGGIKTTFGEAGLLNKSANAGTGVRSATIRAEESPTEVLVLGKEDFESLLQSSYHADLDEKTRALQRIELFGGGNYTPHAHTNDVNDINRHINISTTHTALSVPTTLHPLPISATPTSSIEVPMNWNSSSLAPDNTNVGNLVTADAGEFQSSVLLAAVADRRASQTSSLLSTSVVGSGQRRMTTNGPSTLSGPAAVARRASSQKLMENILADINQNSHNNDTSNANRSKCASVDRHPVKTTEETSDTRIIAPESAGITPAIIALNPCNNNDVVNSCKTAVDDSSPVSISVKSAIVDDPNSHTPPTSGPNSAMSTDHSPVSSPLTIPHSSHSSINPVVSANAPYLKKLALFFDQRIIPPRGLIVSAGSAANEIYVIVKGQCDIIHHLPIRTKKLGEGDEKEKMSGLKRNHPTGHDDEEEKTNPSDRRGTRSSKPNEMGVSNSAPASSLLVATASSNAHAHSTMLTTSNSASKLSSGYTSASNAPTDSFASPPPVSRRREILLGSLAAGQCFGELDHLAPARGRYPFGLRASSTPGAGAVTLLVMARDDWTKRVMGILIDRPTVKKLRARDAWRAERARQLESGGLAALLTASNPLSVTSNNDAFHGMQREWVAAGLNSGKRIVHTHKSIPSISQGPTTAVTYGGANTSRFQAATATPVVPRGNGSRRDAAQHIDMGVLSGSQSARSAVSNASFPSINNTSPLTLSSKQHPKRGISSNSTDSLATLQLPPLFFPPSALSPRGSAAIAASAASVALIAAGGANAVTNTFMSELAAVAHETSMNKQVAGSVNIKDPSNSSLLIQSNSSSRIAAALAPNGIRMRNSPSAGISKQQQMEQNGGTNATQCIPLPVTGMEMTGIWSLSYQGRLMHMATSPSCSTLFGGSISQLSEYPIGSLSHAHSNGIGLVSLPLPSNMSLGRTLTASMSSQDLSVARHFIHQRDERAEEQRRVELRKWTKRERISQYKLGVYQVNNTHIPQIHSPTHSNKDFSPSSLINHTTVPHPTPDHTHMIHSFTHSSSRTHTQSASSNRNRIQLDDTETDPLPVAFVIEGD
jgi:hypothetical protein